MLSDDQVYILMSEIAKTVHVEADKGDQSGLACVLIGDLDQLKYFLTEATDARKKEITLQMIATYQLDADDFKDDGSFHQQVRYILDYWRK